MRRTVHLVRNPLRMVTRAAQEVKRLALDVTLDLVRRGLWRGEMVMPDKPVLTRSTRTISSRSRMRSLWLATGVPPARAAA